MRNVRLLLTTSLATAFAALLLVPSTGLGATDIGRVAATGETLADCNADSGHVTVAAGTNPYVSTVDGVITEWRFRAEVNPGTIVLQVFQPDPNNSSQFTPIVESTPAPLIANQLNKVQTRIPIKTGQEIGLRTTTASHGCYAVNVPGFTDNGTTSPPAPKPGDGPSMYGNGMGNAATNIAATVEPDQDNDGFGDETQDGCPKNASRSDDCVAPSIKIDKGPAKKTSKPKAKFKFSSDDSKATFECSVDDKKFTSCTSPFKVKKLGKGKHSFEVRATDDNKNTSDAASYKWKVKPKKK